MDDLGPLNDDEGEEDDGRLDSVLDRRDGRGNHWSPGATARGSLKVHLLSELRSGRRCGLWPHRSTCTGRECPTPSLSPQAEEQRRSLAGQDRLRRGWKSTESGEMLE